MKNLMMALIGLFLSTQMSFAQISFSHAAGASIFAAGEAASPTLNYAPRLNYQLGDEFTLSLGTHVGAWLAVNSRGENGGEGKVAFDFPIMAELNFGHAAHPDTRSTFGGFAGVGYGFSSMSVESEFGIDRNKAAGIVLNGGVRALLMEKYPIALRVSYLINNKGSANNVLGLGVYWTFGEY